MAAVAVLLAAVVLWRPIALLGSHTLGPWDALTHSTSLLRPTPPAARANTLLTDPVRQALPWAELGRREIRAGRMPLWDELNGCGVPLLANYQSALLSPFTLPFYALSLKHAALLSALAKLACALFFTFALLRELGMSRTASAFAAAVYGGSAGHLLLLLHPHAAVTALLPGLLWLVERVFRAEDDLELAWRRAIPLALLSGIAGLAGHPEMLVVDALLAGSYALVRAVATPRRRTALRNLAFVALAGALGGALAAPQIVPFAEYYANSYAASGVDRFMPILGARELPLLAFPNLAGAPFDSTLPRLGLPRPNYQEANLCYVGTIPIVFACAALVSGAWRTKYALYGAIAVIVAVVVWDLGGLGASVAPLVSLGLIPAGRFYPIWSLSLAVLSAWLVDRAASDGRRARTAVVVVAIALLMAAAARRGAARYIDVESAELQIDAEAWRAAVAPHLRHMLLALAIGALALVAFACTARRWVRAAAAFALIAAQLASTAGVLGRFVSTVRDELVLPRTEAIETLRAHAGGRRVLFLSTDQVWADSNVAYGLNTVSSYDALEIRDRCVLASRMFGLQGYAGATLRASPQSLALFGVELVTASSDWLPIGTQFALEADDPDDCEPYLRLRAPGGAQGKQGRVGVDRAGLRQEFRPDTAGLDSLALRWFTDAREPPAQIEIELVDLDAGCSVLVERVSTGVQRPVPLSGLETVVRFAPIADSAGRSFALDVRRADDGGGTPELLRLGAASRAMLASEGDDLVDAAGRFAGWRLSKGGKPTHGRIVLDLGGWTAFTPLARAGEQTIFRWDGSRGRAWTVVESELAATHDLALDMVLRPSFDPYKTVVLEDPGPLAAGASASPCELVWTDDSPQRQAWRTRGESASYLVLSHPFYPGWKARIDGEAAPLVRANFAFSAIALPAGEHEVELAYEPRSFTLGLLLAGASALALIGLALAARRQRVP